MQLGGERPTEHDAALLSELEHRIRLHHKDDKDDKKIEHVWIPGEGVVAKA